MRTGNILPCATVDRPLLGNLYDNTLNLMPGSIACLCDIHFQQDVVHGTDDRENFEAEKRGYVARRVSRRRAPRPTGTGRLRPCAVAIASLMSCNRLLANMEPS